MKKYVWPVVGLGVLVLLVMWAMGGKSGEQQNASVTPTPSATPKTSVKPKSPTPSTPVSGGVIDGHLTYGQAVQKYAGARIQFDQYCQAVPSSTSYKNGTAVMFDNRSGDARQIALNGTVYSLGGYGFKVIVLTSAQLPREIKIDCGAARNVGTILLQK